MRKGTEVSGERGSNSGGLESSSSGAAQFEWRRNDVPDESGPLGSGWPDARGGPEKPKRPWALHQLIIIAGATVHPQVKSTFWHNPRQ
jgi:hypothetical protein